MPITHKVMLGVLAFGPVLVVLMLLAPIPMWVPLAYCGAAFAAAVAEGLGAGGIAGPHGQYVDRREHPNAFALIAFAYSLIAVAAFVGAILWRT